MSVVGMALGFLPQKGGLGRSASCGTAPTIATDARTLCEALVRPATRRSTLMVLVKTASGTNLPVI